MKVTITQVIDGKVKPIFSLTAPFDVQIEIDVRGQMRRFCLSHRAGMDVLRITVDGRLVIHPDTANSIRLEEAR